jgi:hypothetical protein
LGEDEWVAFLSASCPKARVEKTPLRIMPTRKTKAEKKLTKKIKRRERTPPLAMKGNAILRRRDAAHI